MFFSQHAVKSVISKEHCFTVVFANDVPPIHNMGVVIGYANRAQLSAGRTSFEIVPASDNRCNLKPKGDRVKISPDTLRKHAIHFLIEVGFMPESKRPKPATPAKEQSQFDTIAQVIA